MIVVLSGGRFICCSKVVDVVMFIAISPKAKGGSIATIISAILAVALVLCMTPLSVCMGMKFYKRYDCM